jgi:hypothetical protein
MNRLTGFPVENGARRPWIFNPSPEKLPQYIGAEKSTEYFNKLAAAINDENVLLEFYLQLKNFDLKSVIIKSVEKSEMQQKMKDNAKSPMVEFLSQIVHDQQKKDEYCVHTTKLLEEYTSFLKARNMKYDVTQKNFNDELEIEYKVKKYDSCGRPKFKLIVAELRQYLEKEYKVKFKTIEEKDDEYEHGTLDDEIAHMEDRLKDLYRKKIERDQKAKEEPIPKEEEEPKKYFAKFPVKKQLIMRNHSV